MLGAAMIILRQWQFIKQLAEKYDSIHLALDFMQLTLQVD